MPLKIDQSLGDHSRLLLWEITESEQQLSQQIQLQPARSARLHGMRSEVHRCGFLAIRHLLAQAGYTDADLVYGPTGKPRLSDGKCISISHSHQLAGLLISSIEVGLDIERIKDTITRIAPKFLSPIELQWCSLENIPQITLLWCVKEAVFKVKDQVGISFKDHIHTQPLHEQTLRSTAQLHWNDQLETFEIYGLLESDYAIVYTHETQTTL